MKYWLGLGSNLGDRGAALQGAIDRLAAHGVRPTAVSRVFETAPREVTDQPDFLNAAVAVETDLDPLALLDTVKGIELELGREPGPRWGPRAVDIDLLMWDGGAVDHERLVIPHPRLVERRFALMPLLDVGPDLMLPDGRALWAIATTLDPFEQPVNFTTIRLLVPGVE